MAIKKILTIYDGTPGLLQTGDITPDGLAASEAKSMAMSADSVALKAESIAKLTGADTASTAERSESLARVGGSIARRAESQGVLDNSIANRAESVGTRAESVGKYANSYAHSLNGEQTYSYAVVTNSIANRAESIGYNAVSLARLAEESTDISEAASMAVFATQTVFTIAASGAGGSRKGKLVYKDATTGHVALAKADNPATMPAFGVIVTDLDTSCKVGTLTAPYNVALDSAAANAPVAGDRLFVSRLQAGCATESVATSAESAAGARAVTQIIGIANDAPAAGKVPTILNPGMSITL